MFESSSTLLPLCLVSVTGVLVEKGRNHSCSSEAVLRWQSHERLQQNTRTVRQLHRNQFRLTLSSRQLWRRLLEQEIPALAAQNYKIEP